MAVNTKLPECAQGNYLCSGPAFGSNYAYRPSYRKKVHGIPVPTGTITIADKLHELMELTSFDEAWDITAEIRTREYLY